MDTAQIGDWQNNKLLPNVIWTPCECICDIYPGTECFSWSSDTEERIREWKQELMLSDKELDEIKKFCDDLFKKNKLGWSSVFFDLESANSFRDKINTVVKKHWKTLCIATTPNYLEEYIQEFKQNEDSKYSEDEICKALRKKTVCPDISNGLLGFEILGFEYGGFHTFMCNSLENDYSEKLGIQLNKNGLIDNFEEAEKAAEFTNSPEVGAEPALWQPWAIIEITEANNRLHLSTGAKAF